MDMSQNNGQQALLAQHALVMLGFIIPGGEVLGTWFVKRACQNERPEVVQILHKNWAFQTTWFLIRIFLILFTVAWVAASVFNKNAPTDVSFHSTETTVQSTDDGINIPHEPDESSFFNSAEQKIHMAFMGDNLFQWGKVAYALILAMITSVFLWFATMFLSLVNLALVAGGQPGFYPMILPWLRQ